MKEKKGRKEGGRDRLESLRKKDRKERMKEERQGRGGKQERKKRGERSDRGKTMEEEEKEKKKRNEKRVSISRMKFESNLQIGSKIGKPRPSEVIFKQEQ